MFTCACILGLSLLATLPAEALSNSFLQLGRGQRSIGDWDETEVNICTFGVGQDSDRQVKVFADQSDNTRYVSFAREGFISDDGFIESMVKCKGALPDSCLHKSLTNTPSGCAMCPCEVDMNHRPYGNYQTRMLQLLVPECQAHASELGAGPFRILLVGLGGGALAQYVLKQCPQGTRLDAVEYDPRMIAAATHFFGLNPHLGVLNVEQGDGGAIVAAHAAAGQTYNMVLVDAYEGGPHVPESCRNATFIKDLRHVLQRNGTVLHNIKVDYEATLPLYKEGFGSNSVKGEQLAGNGEMPSHLIVAKMS